MYRLVVKSANLVGQEKFLQILPYFPTCKSCGRLYVARAERYYAEEKKVSYSCLGSKIGNTDIQGCGHRGESDVRKADGKLAWKVEFAARWLLLMLDLKPSEKTLWILFV